MILGRLRNAAVIALKREVFEGNERCQLVRFEASFQLILKMQRFCLGLNPSCHPSPPRRRSETSRTREYSSDPQIPRESQRAQTWGDQVSPCTSDVPALLNRDQGSRSLSKPQED